MLHRFGVIRATWPATLVMSRVRTRVASSDWWASRKVVSVTATLFCSRSARAKPSGPSESSCCRVPSGAGTSSAMWGSLLTGSTLTGALPCGWLTVTSARKLSSLVPRSAEDRAVSRCGWSSMNAVERRPALKSASSSTACRNGMFVATPRIRNSATARRARSTASANVRPRQVSLVSIESKCALTSAPV